MSSLPPLCEESDDEGTFEDVRNQSEKSCDEGTYEEVCNQSEESCDEGTFEAVRNQSEEGSDERTFEELLEILESHTVTIPDSETDRPMQDVSNSDTADGQTVSDTGTTNVDTNIHTTFNGLRIVDLDYISEQIDHGCDSCKSVLSLSHIKSEHRIGLASILNFVCPSCGKSKKVYTSKKHYPNRRCFIYGQFECKSSHTKTTYFQRQNYI